jgi:hypothetical protein
MANITITHPEITKQWHPTKNGDLNPEKFTYGSEKIVWWLCPATTKCNAGCVHEWEAPIYRRTGAYALCPYCTKKCCIHTSFAYLHSELAKEWHPTKNGKCKPTDVLASADKNIWWLCEKMCKYGCKHEWQTSITRRKNGSKCPYCIREKICVHSSIVFTHPELVEQWHPTKNGKIIPAEVSPSSGHPPIWWVCDKHDDAYCEYVYNRTDRIGCPRCKIK